MRSVNELMNLRGRVALVTGGAGHIGRAAVDALAELGARVMILDKEEGRCEEAAQFVRESYDAEVDFLAVDLECMEDIVSIPGHVAECFGRLDILVHCAALVGTSDLQGWATPFEQQRPDPWKRALQVNLTAPFFLTQACTPLLRASSCASIIHVASIYGVVGPDMRLYEGGLGGNPAAYGVSKGGLIQLTRWLATALAPGIRVNSISPGGVWRGQDPQFIERYEARTPMGRMATEEDFKGAVAYFASDLSAYVTGQDLLVDGGWTAW